MGVNGIYGLSGSGLDIESMVKVGMMSKQNEYDKMQQKYTLNEWKKTAFVDVYNKIQTFNNSTLSQYKMSNNMDAHTAESDNSAIKVTANSNAPIMRHTVEVGVAATNAYLIGTNSLERKGDAASTSTQLGDVLFDNLGKVGDNVTYKDDNGNTQIKSKDDVAFSFLVSDGVNGGITSTNQKAVQAKVADVSAATSGEYKVEVNQLAEGVKLSGSAASMTRYDGNGNVSAGSTSSQLKDLLFKELTIENGKVTSYENLVGQNRTAATKDLNAGASAVNFTIGDGSTNTAQVTVSYSEVAGGFTLGDLADRINTQAAANGLTISASYDEDTQAFSIVNSATGSGSNVSISTTYNNSSTGQFAGTTTTQLLNGLKLNDGTSTLSYSLSTYGQTPVTTTSASGKNAELTVNGTAVSSSTNEYTQDGITFDLKDTGESTVKVDTAAISKNTISVTYGQLADGYSFNDLTSAINGLGQNARATYDSVNDKFSFYNSNSGEGNTVALAMASGEAGANAATFFNGLGLTQSTNGTLAESATTFAAGEVSVVAGSDAKVKIDGVDYNLSENKASVNGVTYDFANATTGSSASVAVTQDKEKIIENVKSFIDNYNTLLADLYKAYDEKPNKSYKPLTDSQRDGMKDEQIEKWEEKAKAGMLYHDQTLGKLIDEMRSAMSSKIEGIAGKYDSIFSIGISTKGVKGQLQLDEDKLRAALNEDSEAVYNVFAKLDAKDYNNSAKSGVAQRLGDVFSANLKNIKSVSGSDLTTNDDSDLSKLMRELQTKMSNFKSLMNAFENKLYKKYDAMESVLAGLGVQLNYVTSAFA